MKLPPYPKYKASGVEWLGDVPEHWETKPLMHLTAPARPIMYGIVLPGPNVDDGVLIVKGGDVKPGRLSVEYLCRTTTEIEAGYVRSRLAEGDIVFSIRGTVGEAELVPHEIAGANLTQDAARISCGKSLNREYALYCLKARAVIDPLLSLSLGAAVRGVNIRDLKRVAVLLPPPAEQKAIAYFLKRETANIDTLVSKKRTLIQRLKEKRTALISRTVTRGLPPDVARDVGHDPHPKLKQSGNDWVDDIPEHWNVVPLTKYITEKTDYRGKTPEKTESGIFLVTAKNVRMGFIDYESSQEFVAEDAYEEIMRRGVPKLGDILFTTEAPLGNVALVDRANVALAQRIIRFRMKSDHFCGTFALYAMMSDYFQSQLQSLSTGSTAEGLKASKLFSLRLVAPPLSEQHKIVEFLNAETSRIDRMIANSETAIERLREYRTALITAAVTGKIDVRGAGVSTAADN